MALLDAAADRAAGIQYEGETPPQPSHEDGIAMRAWALLANASGGLDWAGLPVVCEWLGVQDVDGLLWRLSVIKDARRKHQAQQPRADDPDPYSATTPTGATTWH